MLRLPSFLAVAGAAWILFRVARRRWGSEAAWLALAIFALLRDVSFAASDARPYGLGLFCVVLSTALLPPLLENPGLRAAFWYAVTAALTIHFQILFGAVLAGHALYVGYRWIRDRTLPTAYLMLAVTLLVLFTTPLIPYLRSVAKNAHTHDFASPVFADVIQVSLPFYVTLSLLLVGIASALFVTPRIELRSEKGSNELGLAVLVGFVAPFALLAASVVSRTDLLLPRYRLFASGGQALCFGVLAASIRPRTVMRLVALVLAAASLISLPHVFSSRHTAYLGDWGAAVNFLDHETSQDHVPVLIRSQFIESDTMPVEPVANNPVFAPLIYYPSHAHLIGLGASFGSPQVPRVEQALRQSAAASQRILLVAMDAPRPLGPLVWYIMGRLGPGTGMRELANFDGIKVIEFRPNPPTR